MMNNEHFYVDFENNTIRFTDSNELRYALNAIRQRRENEEKKTVVVPKFDQEWHLPDW